MVPSDNPPPTSFGSGSLPNSGPASAPGVSPPGAFQLPPPPTPDYAVDPEIFEAWKKYMKEGFNHNNEMFKKVLDAFMRPYWMTVTMYRILFGVGISGFVVAAILGAWKGWEFAAIFGGLSVVSFVGYFIGRPLQALEENIMLITWLGVVYNTYWTQLMYANDPQTFQDDMAAITQKTLDDINRLIDKHSELSGKRPKLENTPGDV